MTEAEWRQCADPERVLEWSGDGVTPRKLRLLAAAACRRVGHLIHDPAKRDAIGLVERYADGGATEGERQDVLAEMAGGDDEYRPADRDAASAAYEAATAVWQAVAPDDPAEAAAEACTSAAGAAAAAAAESPSGISWEDAHAAERAAQAALARDLFGNPFRPVAPDPAWLTPEVTSLARSIYDAYDFARLPALAAALERAGCADDQVLSHCRQPGEHARGCWVVDLVLGKG